MHCPMHISCLIVKKTRQSSFWYSWLVQFCYAMYPFARSGLFPHYRRTLQHIRKAFFKEIAAFNEKIVLEKKYLFSYYTH